MRVPTPSSSAPREPDGVAFDPARPGRGRFDDPHRRASVRAVDAAVGGQTTIVCAELVLDDLAAVEGVRWQSSTATAPNAGSVASRWSRILLELRVRVPRRRCVRGGCTREVFAYDISRLARLGASTTRRLRDIHPAPSHAEKDHDGRGRPRARLLLRHRQGHRPGPDQRTAGGTHRRGRSGRRTVGDGRVFRCRRLQGAGSSPTDSTRTCSLPASARRRRSPKRVRRRRVRSVRLCTPLCRCGR